MSDEEKSAGSAGTATAAAGQPSDQPSLDEHTTEPNAPEAVKSTSSGQPRQWQMPKPKFQQTSGYLPQGYLKSIEEETPTIGFGGSEHTTEEQAPFIPSPPKQDGTAAEFAVAVEPQPDLSEQLIPDDRDRDDSEVTASAKKGSSFPIVAFVLIGIVLFVVVFLAVVYFLFLAKPSGGNNF